jgi:hypothetical protein
MSDEIIVRPDFDQVLADEKNREIIEEFESEAKTRTLGGWWARIVTSLAVATTIFALYYAAAGAEIPFTTFVLVPTVSILGETITTKQIYEMLFLGAILTLTFLLYPAHHRFIKRVHPVLDLVPAAAAIASALYVLVNFEQVIYRANSPTPTDFVFGIMAILVVLEAARRTIGWHLPVLGLIAIGYAYLADFMPGPFRGPPKNLDDIVANQYLGTDGMIGQPWCGAFLGYALRHVAGVEVPDQIVWVPHVMEWARHGRDGFVSWSGWGAGRLGDLVLLSVEAGGEIDHMGIHVGKTVQLGGETHVLTIEGNTSSGQGGTEGVYARARQRSAVVGFARPAYGGP